MNDLMIVKKNETEFPVDCRDVHAKLESKKDYTNWIKSRLKRFGFIEGVDFSPNRAKNGPVKRGRPQSEYFCTYDMAKELCLVESTAKGREVRQYFIEMEKQAREQAKLSFEGMSPAEKFLAQAQAWVDYERKMNKMADKLEEVEIEARQDNDTLTHDQISELDELISKVARKSGDIRNVGRIRKAIKQGSFQITGSRTYKEIPRRDFEKAKQIVMNFR